jgi:two-component system phosphate regulon response regulator PhoB
MLMSGKNILIVEDEKPIREMVGFSLGRAGFSVTEAGDISEAFECLARQLPDLILLDWMLPGASGLELARRLKRDDLTRDVPIIMLTARGEEEDKVTGLEAGADDYITKPFSPRELQARIRAVLRRSSSEDGAGVVRIEGLELDTESHRVNANQAPVDMGPTEFRLLEFFMTHPERVYSREQLLDRVWGRNSFVEERTVDVHILRLRKALAPSGYESMIQTVRGAGYRLSSRV